MCAEWVERSRLTVLYCPGGRCASCHHCVRRRHPIAVLAITVQVGNLSPSREMCLARHGPPILHEGTQTKWRICCGRLSNTGAKSGQPSLPLDRPCKTRADRNSLKIKRRALRGPWGSSSADQRLSDTSRVPTKLSTASPSTSSPQAWIARFRELAKRLGTTGVAQSRAISGLAQPAHWTRRLPCTACTRWEGR